MGLGGLAGLQPCPELLLQVLGIAVVFFTVMVKVVMPGAVELSVPGTLGKMNPSLFKDRAGTASCSCSSPACAMEEFMAPTHSYDKC